MCSDLPVLPLGVSPSHAKGVCRYRFGTITVTALCDGHFALDAHDVLRGGYAPLDTMLDDARLDDVVPSHVNAFLVDDGEHRILIDAGAGTLQGDTLGRLQLRLNAAGHDVDAIDAILLTHLHPDHIGGLTLEGKAVFPHAIVHVSTDEAQFWLDTTGCNEVDASVDATFEHARAVLRPYIATGRYRTFEPGTSWYGHLTAEPLVGHTRGHTGYRLRTDERDIVFCGDLFHVAAVQLADPSVTVCYDSEPTQARITRETFLTSASARDDLVAAAHAPFPGIGYVRRDVHGYAWMSL